MSRAKTTVYLDAVDYERPKAIARRERRGPRRPGTRGGGDGAVSVIVAGYLAATQLGHRVPRDL